jgi:Tfp pilus assembly protein FimT
MHIRLHSSQRGLTLFEILIVLGLMTTLATLTLFISFGTYRDSSYHDDRAMLIAALQHARAESIDDVCIGTTCVTGMPHGVSIQEDRYVVFQGTSFVSRYTDADQVIEANPNINRTGLIEILFAPSSGNAQITGTITLSDMSGHVSTTTIGSQGQILWSN